MRNVNIPVHFTKYKLSHIHCSACAVVHKWLWFSSHENVQPTEREFCACHDSVCFCTYDIILLFICVWLVPFVLIVFCQPAEEKVQKDSQSKGTSSYKKSEDKDFLDSVKAVLARKKNETSQSLRRLLFMS